MTSNAFSLRSARLRKISSQRTSPARTASLNVATSERVLGTTVTKEPALAIDRAQVLLRAQLAVSDVNEARMLQQGADATPRLQMDPIVGLVAVVGLEVHRHGAVACYAKTIDQLLEIGTALFAVPLLELNGLGILTVVGSAHHDARGIVVDLLHLESEAVHNRQYDA